MALASVTLELARSIDAKPIALMSRDQIEAGLEWKWRAPAIRAFISDPESSVLCARCTLGPTEFLGGFGIMQFGSEVAHLNLLAVDPRVRRQGLGEQLLTWLETTAVTAGLYRIDLEVRANNRGARRFYEELGYKASRTIRGYYQGRESALKMHKKLRDRPNFSREPRDN